MKLIPLRLLVVYGLAGISGVVLLYTSQSVQKAENRLAAIEASAESEAEAVRVLKAEWAYLNSPARLEELAQEFLHMEPAAPGDMMAQPSLLPEVVQEEDVITEIPAPALVQEISLTPEAPAPVRPAKKPAPPVRNKPEKSFDDLLGEIGGGQ